MVGRPRHQVRLSVIKQLSDIELDVATEFFILHFTDLNTFAGDEYENMNYGPAGPKVFSLKVGPGDNWESAATPRIMTELPFTE